MLQPVVGIFILCILASLSFALYYLVKERGSSKSTVKALTFRISLSLLLFSLLAIGAFMGLVKPHPLGPTLVTTSTQK